MLEGAGLITRDRKAQWRSSSLRAEPLKEATTWMEHLTHLWDDRFDRLDAHLAALMQRPTTSRRRRPDSPTTREKTR